MEKLKPIEEKIYCHDCGLCLTGKTGFYYQDEQGHDLQPGFYCDVCADERDEDGEIIE